MSEDEKTDPAIAHTMPPPPAGLEDSYLVRAIEAMANYHTELRNFRSEVFRQFDERGRRDDANWKLVRSEISGTRQDVQKLHDRLDRLETDVGQTKSEIGTLKQHVTDLKTRVGMLENVKGSKGSR